MRSGYELSKKFYIIFYTAIVLLILSVVGFSFSYYKSNVTGNGTPQVGNAGTLIINYENETVISMTNAYPIYESGYKENANKLEFSITGSGSNITGCYKLELDIKTLSDGLKNEDFLWILYDKNQRDIVSRGSFLTAEQGDVLTLLNNQVLTSETDIDYTLYVFIRYSNVNDQLSMMNSTFEGKIRGTVNTEICEGGSTVGNTELSATSGVLFVNGSNRTLTVNGDSVGTVTCESQDTSIVTCSVSDKTVSISPAGLGTTSVIIRESNGNTFEYSAEVKLTEITLSSSSGTAYLPQTHNSNLTAVIDGENYGILSCASSDPSKATCDISGSNLVITPLAVTGNTPVRITVTEDNGDETATYDATIENSTYQLTLAKGTNSAGIGTMTASGCTGSSSPYTCVYNSSVTVTAPANAGYTVNDALISSDTSLFANRTNGTAFTMPGMPNGTQITLTANALANTYTVTYNGNGNTGGSTANSSHTYGTAKVLTTNGYTKTGHNFTGWKINNTGTLYTNGQNVSNLTTTDNGTVTMYAQWEAKNTVVTFDNQSATSGGYPQTTISYGTAPGIIQFSTMLNPQKAGYQFGGYYTGTNGTGTQIFNTSGGLVSAWTIESSTVTLYAKFTPNTYTLNLVKGTNSAGIGTMTASGCTTITSGSSYTCTLGTQVTINATISSATTSYVYGWNGWTSNNTTYIANSSNNQYSFTANPTPGSTITLTANATQSACQYNSCSITTCSGCNGIGTQASTNGCPAKSCTSSNYSSCIANYWGNFRFSYCSGTSGVGTQTNSCTNATRNYTMPNYSSCQTFYFWYSSSFDTAVQFSVGEVNGTSSACTEACSFVGSELGLSLQSAYSSSATTFNYKNTNYQGYPCNCYDPWGSATYRGNVGWTTIGDSNF